MNRSMSAQSNALMAEPDRTLINGRAATFSSLHQSLVDAAEAYIDLRQRAPCLPGTKLLFARMDTHGIGNDINLAVRALSVAMIQERQLILLPPSSSDVRQATWRGNVALSANEPWHWLAGAQLPFSSLIIESSCQKELSNRNVLRAIASENGTDTTAILRQIGLHSLANVSRYWRPIWRVGLDAGVIPLPFRSQGMLWWFQVLTNYLIRIRSPLSPLIDRHPAMLAFLRRHSPRANGPSLRAAAPARHGPTGLVMSMREDVGASFGRSWCRKRWCDHLGPGWHPAVWFDVSLHIRLGDVCGKNAPVKGQRARKCTAQPTEDALSLMQSHGLRGSLFMASDSRDAVDLAHVIGPRYGFNVSSLSLDRGVVEGANALGTEKQRRTPDRDRSVIVESLMDAMLLSRSDVLVGSMMSNFPRLALQMRVQTPRRGQLRYVALDDRTWCTRTSCRLNCACQWHRRNPAAEPHESITACVLDPVPSRHARAKCERRMVSTHVPAATDSDFFNTI